MLFRDTPESHPTDRILSLGLTSDRTVSHDGVRYDVVLDSETKRTLRDRETGLSHRFHRDARTGRWSGWESGEWHYLALAIDKHALKAGRRHSDEWSARTTHLRACALGQQPTPFADIVAVRDIQAERLKDERRRELAIEMAAAMNASSLPAPDERAGRVATMPLAAD